LGIYWAHWRVFSDRINAIYDWGVNRQENLTPWEADKIDPGPMN
jgi:hypothetical protein